MKKQLKNFYIKQKYLIYMILFLVIFHGICNFNIKTISFSSDEYIPLAIAAKLSGLDWMNSRIFNYYYGYITLLFFIPIFKIPFIYKNTFLLTQVLLGINSIFHIIATVIVYLSACMLFEEHKNKKIISIVSLISSCSLQIFNVSLGIQIESLFVLAYAICFYHIVRMNKYKAKYYDMISLAFFSFVAIANNSRGYVLLVSVFICVSLMCIQERKYIKYLVCFIVSAIVFLSIHKYLINPNYSVLFDSNAHNTTSQPIIQNLILTLTNFDYFKNFVKTFIGWMWSTQLSTFGLFFITFILIFKEYKQFFKTKTIKNIIIPSFIILNIIGISLLCIIMFMHGIMNGGLANRADILFYVRYFVGILIISNLYALYGLIEHKVLVSIIEKISYVVLTIIFSLLTIRFVVNMVCGSNYGVNNTVVISLFLRGFDESYRYGIVTMEPFYFMFAFITILVFIIICSKNNKRVMLSFMSVLTLFNCIIYSRNIASKKSDYYNEIFEENIIDKCNEYDNLSIYAADFATTLQYFVPKAKIYCRFDDQDILILNEEKKYLLNKSNNNYKCLLKNDKWTLYKKIGNKYLTN